MSRNQFRRKYPNYVINFVTSIPKILLSVFYKGIYHCTIKRLKYRPKIFVIHLRFKSITMLSPVEKLIFDTCDINFIFAPSFKWRLNAYLKNSWKYFEIKVYKGDISYRLRILLPKRSYFNLHLSLARTS